MLPDEIIGRLKLEYPSGFATNLISYTSKEGTKVSALPFETDEVYYLIRMTQEKAQQIIDDDDDYDEDGNLRDDFSMEDEDEFMEEEDEDEDQD
ncbi:hypothetical protein V6R21_13775 [Limibacter armeniacum]|uniref:hypothetical protein n=1 Tax=Limibacter armeniacum TaxID=466084 RepID=UPI002FE56560